MENGSRERQTGRKEILKMPKNTLEDLNNHLFDQLERLLDEDMSAEQLDNEIHRSKAVTSVAEVIVRNGELALGVMKHLNEYRTDGELAPIPKMLGPGK